MCVCVLIFTPPTFSEACASKHQAYVDARPQICMCHLDVCVQWESHSCSLKPIRREAAMSFNEKIKSLRLFVCSVPGPLALWLCLRLEACLGLPFQRTSESVLRFSLRLFRMETLEEPKRNRLIEGALNASVSSPESEINVVIEEEQLALTCLSCAL